MEILGSTLSNILSIRGFDVATLSNRTGISRNDLDNVLQGSGELSGSELEVLAEQLAVPVTALFAKKKLPLFPSIDFREAVPSVRAFKKDTLRAISFVEKIASTFSALKIRVDVDSTAAPISPELKHFEAIKLATKFRDEWGYTLQNQMDSKDANKVYIALRSFIEGLGILVVHRSFKSNDVAGFYAKTEDGLHVIVVNTTGSSKARKLFTLAHEFCHVLLRADGASNPSIIKNDLERFCNKFAAYLLAPDDLILKGIEQFDYKVSSDNTFIRLFSKRLGISQEALFIRLVEMGKLTESDYSLWKSQFSGPVPTGDQEDGGGRSDPLQNKRTSYGGLLLNLLGRARSNGDLDELDIYRLCGLKPKYQKQLFEAI